MNWQQMEGKWKQYSGKVREQWGKLTDRDLEVIHGRREQLLGKIQERYGIVREEAERQVDEFMSADRGDGKQEPERQKSRRAGRSCPRLPGNRAVVAGHLQVADTA
jgi:uncharacterized protein YjbJ (UPF0337 family)